MQALKSIKAQEAAIRRVAIPKLRDSYVLCKVNAVALNPTDWKHVEFLPTQGATVGCDFAGTVEEVGAVVAKKWAKGDRIAGFVHGVNAVQTEDGCFAEYCVAKGDLQMKIPDNMSDEEAATLGVGVTTVGQALYQSLGLALPGSEEGSGKYVLVYGGSTATGSLAIQYAVRSGYRVITTCSAANADFVRKLGASEVFDYRDVDCGKKIREFTNNQLSHAFDCISNTSSAEICCDAVSSEGGKVTYLDPVQHSRSDVECKSTLAYSAIGEAFKIANNGFEASLEDFEFSKHFWSLSTDLFARKQIIPHPVKRMEGGLQGVLGGLKLMKEGKVSGEKLVYNISQE